MIIYSRILLVILFYISGTYHQLMYIAFPLMAILSTIENKNQINSSPIIKHYTIIIISIASITCLQFIWNNSIDLFSLKGLLRYFTYWCLSIWIANFSKDTLLSFGNTCVYLFSLLTPYAFIEALLKDRYVFIFHHANNLAYVLVLLFFYTLYYVSSYKTICAIALIISIFLTKSTGGLIALIIILIYYFLQRPQLKLIHKLLLTVITISGIAIMLSLIPNRSSEQFDSLSNIDWNLVWERAQSQKFGSYGSGIWRITYWLAILNEFLLEPTQNIILGKGIDTLTLGNYTYGFMTRDPHNDYLKIFVEIGVLGLIMLVYHLYKIYWLSQKDVLLLLLIIIPMYFGNIWVNLPFNILFIYLITLKHKLSTEIQ